MAENFDSFQNNPLENSTYTLEQQNSESEGTRSQGLSNRDTDAKSNDLEREPEQMQMLRKEIQEAIAALKKENADLRLEIEEYVKLLMTDRFANKTRAPAEPFEPQEMNLLNSAILGAALLCIISGLWTNFARERKFQKLLAYYKTVSQKDRQQMQLEESHKLDSERSDAFVEAIIQNRDFKHHTIETEKDRLALREQELNYSFELVKDDNQNIKTEIEASHGRLQNLEKTKSSQSTIKRLQAASDRHAQLKSKVQEMKPKEANDEIGGSEKSRNCHDTQCALEYLQSWQANRGTLRKLPISIHQMMNSQLCK